MAYEGPKIRARQCQFVLYPESQQPEIEWVQKNYSCAWALHDKDCWLESDKRAWESSNESDFPHAVGELKKPHVHFIAVFKNPRYFHGIANEIGVPFNTINRCNNLFKAYEYLCHKNNPEKYQYDETIVGTNEFDIPTENGSAGDEEEQVGKLLDMPYYESAADCARWAFENGCWATYRKAYGIWRDIRSERAYKMAQEKAAYATSQQNPQADDFANQFRPVVKEVPKEFREKE